MLQHPELRAPTGSTLQRSGLPSPTRMMIQRPILPTLTVTILQQPMQAPTFPSTTLPPWSVLKLQHEGESNLLPCTTLPPYSASYHFPWKLQPSIHHNKPCFIILRLYPPELKYNTKKIAIQSLVNHICFCLICTSIENPSNLHQ